MIINNIDNGLKVLDTGTYTLRYISDGLNSDEKTMYMIFEVVNAEDPNVIGYRTKYDTVFSNESKRIEAIGNALRIAVFKSIIGKENFELFSLLKDSTFMYNRIFKCVVEQKEDLFDPFMPIKNTFKGFECILNDEEKKSIYNELCSRLEGE